MEGTPRVYRAETGRYVTGTEIWRKFETDEWTPYRWDADTGTEWVQTVDGDVLKLEPVTQLELPDHVELVPTDDGAVVRADD